MCRLPVAYGEMRIQTTAWVTLITKSDKIGGTYYQNPDRFITYACQKDNEHKENWIKWELGLRISKSDH